MKNKFHKITTPVPNESDFVKAIFSLDGHRIPNFLMRRNRVCNDDEDAVITQLRESYAYQVTSAEQSFSDMLDKVVKEFPPLGKLDPLYASILDKRFNMHRYFTALSHVSHAIKMIDIISDDCEHKLLHPGFRYSLKECKSLKVTALACMITLVKRCIPVLAYLAKVQVYMGNLRVVDATAVWVQLGVDGVLPPALEDGIFPHLVRADKIISFVAPETVFWLENLDRRFDLWRKGEYYHDVDCALPTDANLVPSLIIC